MLNPIIQLAGQRYCLLQFPTHLPLLVPVERLGNRADVGLFDRVTALGGPGQEEDLFLNVGGEVV